jgi:ABC-type multidrug transport system ATPase subunit
MKINIKESLKQIELYKNIENNRKYSFYDSIFEKSYKFRNEIKYKNFSDSFLLRKAYLNVNKLSIICIKSFIEILTFALMIADPDDLNEYLRKKLFKYEIKIQQNSILIDDINIDINVFFIERSNNTSETKLLHYNLSAGEKISLFIYLWEYLYQNNYDLATNFKCILIDEPDSHLHPTKCKELIQFIQEKLIKEMNFQVFITTHHPVTASFINDENLFLMYQSEDGKTKLKNTKQCIIHPIDYLAENLFVLSKPINYVFVESELRKKFLEPIYKQFSFATLESKTDSNHLKLFKHSKLEFLVYDECVKEFKDTNKENNRLKKEIKEIIENLKSFNEISKDNKTFKKYEKTLVSSVKRIKYSYFDPFHLDLINKYAQIIENALVELDEINDINKIVIKLFENFQKELNIFDKPKERAQLLRKKLIASVQNGNGLQLNNSSFSVGYVRNHSCFETKEFLIEELRRVENYLFDPVNIYLIMKEINFNNKFLNELKTLNEQQVLEKIQEKIESIDENLDMKTVKLIAFNKENIYFNLDYKKFIFKSEEKLVDLIHDVFCDNQCSYKDYKPKNDCFFKILQEFFDKYYNLNLNIYEKYSFGLLCLISEKKLQLLIPFELLRRFNYMELFLKYRFQTKYHPVHDLFEDKKFEQAKEIINGKENRVNEFFTDLIEMNSIKTSFNNFIHMFIPDMSFRTPIHTLIRMSKFDELFEICKQEKIDSLKKQLEKKESLENSIILYMFYFIESFKQITLNELEIYSDILQSIDRNQLKLHKDKDNFKSIVSSLKSVFEIIKENLKSTDTLFGLIKDIGDEEDDESDQD